MGFSTRIRRGDGPAWSRIKALARYVLQFHIPVYGATKAVFKAIYVFHLVCREGLAWGLRCFWDEPLFRSQCVSVGRNFRMEQLPYIVGEGRIILGDGVRISGKAGLAFNNRSLQLPELTVGDDTFIGHDCKFVVASSIRIGRRCLLAGGTCISDFDGHAFDAAKRHAGVGISPEEIRPVHIEDDVWIGARVTVLKGVTIGARSIVGAGSVVTKDVPPDVVVAGNPAHFIKNLTASRHD